MRRQISMPWTGVAVLLVAAAIVVASPPPRPSSFYGTVTAGGSNVASGTLVSAWIDGTKYAEAAVFLADGLSVYRLDVPGDLPGTPAIEGSLPGQTITLKVGGAQAQTATWQDGAVSRLDLTASLGPDLSITVDDGVTTATPGATLTYTVTVTNHGSGTATGVAVRDALSAATSFVSASDGGTAAGGVVTWPAFDLAEGQTATRTVTARVLASLPAGLETITNVGTVADDGAQGVDPNPDDNTGADVDALDARADLVVTVSNGVAQALPGQRLEYAIIVTNAGTREAAGVVLRNTLPDGVTYFAASDSGVESGRTITWPSFSLAPGASVARRLAARVNDPLSPAVASLVSTAEATAAGGGDQNPADNTATDLDPVIQKPDLAVTSVNTDGSATDPQTLALSGSVTVEIANEGNLDASGGFALVVFEDRNGDGTFTAAADNLLGQESVTDPLPAGGSASVSVPIAGTVLFRDNRISAFVDSGLAIVEHDEANNVGHSGDDCGSVPAAGSFEPVLELNWPRPGIVQPTSVDSDSSPVVVHLTDDNGDGRMDGRDVPSIVFTTANLDPPLGSYIPTLLRAIRGDTGAAIFDVPAAFEGNVFYEFAQATVAAGDVDLDGRPEIVTAHVAGSLHGGPFNVISVYEHNGVRKWRSAPYSTHPAGTATNRDNPAIADVNRDGVPEIVVGAHVFNNNGTLRWKGAGGQGFQSIFNQNGMASGAVSVVADLDLSGNPEIVTGNTAYRSDGSIYWQIAQTDGYPAVADFDGDPFPEIVVVSQGKVRLHEHDGALKWGPVVLPGQTPVAGGPPTVADFDADGEPEIGVASSDFYVVFETDGTVKWQRTTQDFSSGMTGSTVFDFDGDGRFEVVYRDERFLRVYRGEDGTVLFEYPVPSTTLNEQPTVADVDNDGNAEILVTADHGDSDSGVPGNATNAGLRVFGDANDSWVGTRSIWNQHAYSVGNVNDDATIPREPDWSWLSHNTYRAQIAPPGTPAFAAPDLTASRVGVDLSAYPAVTVTVRIGNGGGAAVRSGLPVAFYAGDPMAGGRLLGTKAVSRALRPGEYEDVSFAFTAAAFTDGTVVIAADDDGLGASRESECDEANNRYSYTYDVSVLGLTLAMSDGQSAVLPGDTVTYTMSVFNAGSQEATGVSLTDQLPAHTVVVAADAGGAESGGVVAWPPFSLASGATAVRSLTLRVSEAIPLSVTEIVNQASVADDGAHGPDPTPANNSAVDRNQIASLRADAGGPYEVNEGTAVTYDASGSRDRDGSIVSYHWDLDADGAFDDATGIRVTRTYADEASFTVGVKVTDNSGNTATDTAPVTVRNAAPVVEAGPDRRVVKGAALTLTATTFTDAGTGDAHAATIDWGDGTPVQPGVVNKAGTPWKVTGSHTYAVDGLYTVTVCVSDADGGSGCDPFAVTVADGWILTGTANDTARPGCIRFTDGNWRQGGAAWYSQKLDLTQSFDKTFRVYVGSSPSGVDGLAFTLQNAATGTSSLGALGGYLAYRGISPSVSVELDIFGNVGNYGDPWSFVDPIENHLAVNENGTLDHRGHPAVKLASVEDGREHLLRVIWNGPARTLDVHLDGVERLMYTKDLVEQIFGGVPQVYWGLSAASGDGGAEQYFCETAACQPGTTPLISVGDVQVTESPFGPVDASFPVTLSCAAGHEVQIDAATADGSALAGEDYVATAQTLVFQPGETSKAFEVTVPGDNFSEPTELFFADLSQPQGGDIRYGRGVGTVKEKPWLLLGTANDTVRPGCIRFTDGGWRQGGVAWSSRKIDLTRSFDKTFRVYLGKDDFGVDGLAFVLQNASTGAESIGPVGGYLAYGGISPSVAVEVDTFRNVEDYGDGWRFVDPNGDHIAVDENGRLDHTGHAPGGLPNVEDGKEHLLRIIWNARDRILDVHFDGVERLIYSKDLVNQIFAGATQVFWGLSGASGDGGNEQYFCEVATCAAGEAPLLSVGDARVAESSTGTAAASFPVTLACIPNDEVRVGYRTADGTARAGSDYQRTEGILVFPAGETDGAVEVPVFSDDLAEPAEQLFLDLVPASGIVLLNGRGVGTILDGPPDTRPGTVQLSAATYPVSEDGGSATVQVVREGGSYGQVSVSYATADGTAIAPADYTAASGMVVFAHRESGSKTVVIPVVNDGDPEPEETFRIQLTGASGAPLGPVATAVLAIQDDDASRIPVVAASKVDELAADRDGDGAPSPGDELLYTILITNSGGSAANDVVLTDLPPAHARIVAGSVSTTAGTVASEDPVRVEIGRLAAGEPVTVAFRVTVDDPVPAGVREVSSQGAVTSRELPAVLTDDPDLGGASDPTVTAITAAPKLVAEKTDALADDADGSGAPSPGDTIEYRVTILNNGNTSATDVAFEDAVPEHATLLPGSVEASPGTIESEDPVRVAIGEIRGGEWAEVLFRVVLDNPIATGVREIRSQGTVTSQELPAVPTDDPEAGGSTDPTVTAISAAPALRVEKIDVLFADEDGDGAASPGDAVLYRVTILNEGNTGATGVVLADPIPANASPVAGTVRTSQGTVESERPVRVALGEVAAGSTATVSLQVRIDEEFPHTAIELSNQATVESGELEDVLSDDPETPEPADPTRTPVFLTPDVSIGDAAVDESAGQTSLTVTLSKAGNREAGVSYASGTGSALAGADYTPASGVLTFAPGEMSKTLLLPVLDDLLDELDETLPVALSAPAGARLADAEATVTIRDDDAPPQVSIGDASVTEGDDGTIAAVFAVTLSASSGLDVTVPYATADGTAQAGSDYQAASGALHFPSGTTARMVSVEVVGDRIDEMDESFAVHLSNPASAMLARAAGQSTILDDDEARISAGDAGTPEGNSGTTALEVPVTLSTASDREVRVEYSTSPDTARVGADYTDATGTLVFPPGTTRRTVEVPVLGDVLLEPDETFFLNLARPVNANLEDGRATGAIVDDEVCPGPNLLVNPSFEARLASGAVPGWTTIGGAWQRRASNPAPAEGSAYLASPATSPAEVRQDVDVSAYAAHIAGGGQPFLFSGFVRTASEDPSDVARIVVEYRDAGNTMVLDAFDSGEIASPAGWRAVFDERPAPAGTAWIRVQLEGKGAWFDGLSLVSLRAATLTVRDITVYEGNSGTTQAPFPVRLACLVEGEVQASYATADGTALAGQDYLASSGSLTLPQGTTTTTVQVSVLGDDVHERHETFTLDLIQPTAGLVLLDPRGTGTLVNDDFCPRSPGFWKTHRELWPVQSLVLGAVEYDASGLSALLADDESDDAARHLARQLVATELNLRVGSDPSILPVVQQAHDLLILHPPGSDPRGAAREQVNQVKDRLDAYNNLPCQEEPVIPVP